MGFGSSVSEQAGNLFRGGVLNGLPMTFLSRVEHGKVLDPRENKRTDGLRWNQHDLQNTIKKTINKLDRQPPQERERL